MIWHRLAPIWQQSGTLLFDSCDGIARFLEDELQIWICSPFFEGLPMRTLFFSKKELIIFVKNESKHVSGLGLFCPYGGGGGAILGLPFHRFITIINIICELRRWNWPSRMTSVGFLLIMKTSDKIPSSMICSSNHQCSNSSQYSHSLRCVSMNWL